MFPGRLNAYDGQEEFWVTIRESGKRKHTHSYEETHKKIKEVSVNRDFLSAERERERERESERERE